MWEPQPLATLKASTACAGITLPYLKISREMVSQAHSVKANYFIIIIIIIIIIMFVVVVVIIIVVIIDSVIGHRVLSSARK
jgi:hypothetical protein